jgi:hypothetical protein
MTTADGTFQKALLILDRGQTNRGEELLRAALQQAEEEGDDLTHGRALCCLGELLHELGRDAEAQPLLERMAAVERDDDVLDYEVQRANELLATIAAG